MANHVNDILVFLQVCQALLVALAKLFRCDVDAEERVQAHGVVTCAIETIFSIGDKDYIALLPNLEDEEDVVWFYGYSENPDDPNEEPVLRYIEDDDEYDYVCDAYDEWLDNADFDEM